MVTKVYCPGCSKFLYSAESMLTIRLSCDRCHRDIEFQAVTPKQHETATGRRLNPPIIVLFPVSG